MDSFSVVWEYSNHVEAEIAKGLLESQWIDAVVFSDDCGGMAGGQTFVRGVTLMVASGDMERAKRILQLP